jgi:hypothetical protein
MNLITYFNFNYRYIKLEHVRFDMNKVQNCVDRYRKSFKMFAILPHMPNQLNNVSNLTNKSNKHVDTILNN